MNAKTNGPNQILGLMPCLLFSTLSLRILSFKETPQKRIMPPQIKKRIYKAAEIYVCNRININADAKSEIARYKIAFSTLLQKITFKLAIIAIIDAI